MNCPTCGQQTTSPRLDALWQRIESHPLYPQMVAAIKAGDKQEQSRLAKEWSA